MQEERERGSRKECESASNFKHFTHSNLSPRNTHKPIKVTLVRLYLHYYLLSPIIPLLTTTLKPINHTCHTHHTSHTHPHYQYTHTHRYIFKILLLLLLIHTTHSLMHIIISNKTRLICFLTPQSTIINICLWQYYNAVLIATTVIQCHYCWE